MARLSLGTVRTALRETGSLPSGAVAAKARRAARRQDPADRRGARATPGRGSGREFKLRIQAARALPLSMEGAKARRRSGSRCPALSVMIDSASAGEAGCR